MTLRHVVLTVLSVLLALLIGVPVAAQPAGAAKPGERHIAIELVAETPNPKAGGTVDLAFVATPEPTWHGYWQNPGDAGIPTTLDWTLPKGVTAGTLRYPVPERLLIAGIMNYVYEGPFTQFATLAIPAGLAAGTKLPVRVKLDYLVCTREICVPESAELATELTVGDGAIPAEQRARFDGWRKHLPKPLGSDATFQIADGRFRLGIPFPAAADAKEAYFYPLSEGAVDYAAPQTVTRDGDRLVIETKAGTGKLSEIGGVLAAGGRGFTIRAVPGTVAPGSDGGGVAAGGMTALWAFLFAVAGGLLLNIMPCVFPILSLKALSLAKSGESDAHARGEALAYTAGVVAVCLALGGILLALRAGGATVGWAFQLTDPRFMTVLLLLVTGIAFNLAGLFEIPAPDAANRLAANGRGGAFMTGALAAVIATPCTGPFMGAALGAAIVLPTCAALAVFGGLGLGIALPFLLIGFVPALRRRLPKPGAWMQTFRHILSVPMFLTALALAWLVGRLAGVNAMAIALGAGLVFALTLWLIGRRQARGRGVAGLAVVLLAVTAAGAWVVGPAQAQGAAGTEAALGAEPFSETRLVALRAEGKPVFAYFTADWCVTCKVNEKVAIETDAVRDAFAKAGVTVLVGDWTDGNAELGRFIEKNGRTGVPLYLWYDGKAGEPKVLPQVLTPATLTDLVKGE